jgi:NADH-quinone oxidoreductase subunit L
MEAQHSLLPLFILLLPLCGFILNGVIIPLGLKGFGKTSVAAAASASTIPLAIAFVLGLIAFGQLGESSLLVNAYPWLTIGNLSIDFALKIDRLSGLLVLIITGIGTLIHLFSASYLATEKGIGRYYAYLSLFCFSMLLLVLGNELPLLFFGWEGVGLCSYLLIGFWYTETEKANAGKKAFIANRVGDLGFLIGAFLLFKMIGSFNFDFMAAKFAEWKTTGTFDHYLVTATCLALFVGATGKSAQIPLFVWLPDAMSGPTPVSALIHAATMVTAGVYMIARLNGLFDLAPDALTLIAYVGAFTALFAGTIAIAQKDIKKVLAYSTVSQLGFMFMACGVGAYQTAVFHLMTHAFFKALLFLGSGSVIHACHHEQDMTKMGGLKKYLPHTHLTMLIGSLAISGIPFFSGFFSKDEILYSAIALPGGHAPVFFIGVATAALTAIYTGRMMAMTFYGKERLDHHTKEHLHESPGLMLFPLYVLAGLAAVGGFFGVPHLLGDYLGHMPHALSHWLEPVVPTRVLPLMAVKLPLHEAVVMIGSSLLAIVSFTLGILLFKNKQSITELVSGLAPIEKVLAHKYYIDELYQLVILGPIAKFSQICSEIIDRLGIDGAVNGVGNGARRIGTRLKALQDGDVQTAALWMVAGTALAVAGTLILARM